MDEDQDDPVVAEVDVYLTRGLSDQLYLFQYPLQPVTATQHADELPLSARVKPQQHKVELEVALNTRSANFCRSKGEQLALNVDGGQDEGRMFDGDMMDKQTLTSSQALDNPGQFGVALWHDGALHVTSLAAAVQLRPGFSYLDRADKTQARRAREIAAEAGDSSQDEEGEPEATAVTVKMQRTETDEARARRMASYDYLNKMQQRERWIKCSYFTAAEASSQHVRRLLASARVDDSVEFAMPAQEYLDKIMPSQQESLSTTSAPASGREGTSKAALATLPLADQVKAVVVSARVLRHSQLMTLLPGSPEPGEVLKLLQQGAVLVNGCWVVQSELVYPNNTRSPHSDAPAEALQKGRDYMLWKFSQQPIVSRREIALVTKLPADDVKDMLEGVSRLRVHQGWEFLLDHDKEFIAKHGEIYQRQMMLWETRSRALLKHFKVSGPSSPRKNSFSGGEFPSLGRRRRRHSSRSRSQCSEGGDSGPENRPRSRRASGHSPRHASHSPCVRRVSGIEAALADAIAANPSDAIKGHASGDVTMRENSETESPSVFNPVPTIDTPDNAALTENKNAGNTAVDSSFCDEDSSLMASGGAEIGEGPVKDLSNVYGGDNDVETPMDTSEEPLRSLLKELSDFVRDRLRTRFVQTRSQLRSALPFYLATARPGSALVSYVADSVFDEAVQESGGRALEVVRLKDEVKEPVYAFIPEDDLKPLRELMLKEFEHQKRLRYGCKKLHQKATEAGLQYSQDDCNRVLTDYCHRIKTFYYLKGTGPEL